MSNSIEVECDFNFYIDNFSQAQIYIGYRPKDWRLIVTLREKIGNGVLIIP